MTETYIFNQIVHQAKRFLSAIFMRYVQSGRTIFTTTELVEPLEAEYTYQQTLYKLMVPHDVKSCFDSKNLSERDKEDHPQIHNFLNNLVKRACVESKYQQIGKQPKFFDSNSKFAVDGGLVAYSGFKASTYTCSASTTIVIDHIFKFTTSQSCLSKIDEIVAAYGGKGEWKDAV